MLNYFGTADFADSSLFVLFSLGKFCTQLVDICLQLGNTCRQLVDVCLQLGNITFLPAKIHFLFLTAKFLRMISLFINVTNPMQIRLYVINRTN